MAFSFLGLEMAKFCCFIKFVTVVALSNTEVGRNPITFVKRDSLYFHERAAGTKRSRVD